MKYDCGTEVMIGDEIMVAHGTDKESLAIVVAIGRYLVSDGIDKQFYSWARNEEIIEENTVVIEWLQANPSEDDNPNYSPVGDYMVLECIYCEKFIRRGKNELKKN